MILDVFIDEDIVQESTFLRWRDSEEQQGNVELLGSVSRFFAWLGQYVSRSPAAATSVCSDATSEQISRETRQRAQNLRQVDEIKPV